MRVVIVGGGVMGCATALSLAARGVKDVTVLERAVPGAEASSAAAGMLAPEIESHDSSWIAAREAYASWSEELRSTAGVDIGFRRTGALVVARSDRELEEIGGTRFDVRSIEPGLSPDVIGGTYFPNEAQVDPPQLLRALVVAIARAGVVVRSGTTVSSLAVENGRCTGVHLSTEKLEADVVVLAAGSWSSLVVGVPAEIPVVRPIRGQLVQLEERPPKLRTIVFAGHGYIVPRGDGRVICGSTMEDVGHRREVTAAGLAGILAEAIAIAPALGGAEVVRSWCNFRPSAAGGAPLVGASPLPGLFLATGHHRNGILLAKVTAESVADAVTAAR